MTFSSQALSVMYWQMVRRFLRNPHFARTSNDRFAVCVVLIGAQVAGWYELFHVLPYYHPENSFASTLHIIIGLFLYANSLGNTYKMMRTRTACDLTSLGVSECADWPYCERCLVHRPPRTHHCPACDVCVLRRDHHCWFAGCCVGHANQRYYFFAITYMLAAALYSNLFHWQFVVDHLEHLGRVGTFLCVLMPHVCGVLGFLSLYEFLVAVLTFIALFVLVMLVWLVVIQVGQIAHGQTRHERKLVDDTYDNGLLENVHAALGERWYIAWLCPWIPSSLPENGVIFRVSELKKK